MSFKPYPILTLFTLISLGILLWLGGWQYGRYSEKMVLDDTAPEWSEMRGAVVPGSEAIVYSYVDGKAAWRRVAGVEWGDEIVFVTREVIYAVEPPAPCNGPQCGAGDEFQGKGLFQRPKGRSAFAGKDDPQAGIYYSYDPAVIAAQLPDAEQGQVSGETFEPAETTLSEAGRSLTGDNPFARARLDDALPPQRHFGYAITWWGLAIALLGVYFALHKARGRLRFGGRSGP